MVMAKYPMLMGVDEDRVAKVGGKAAVLEEILRRNSQAKVPSFEYVDDNEPAYPTDGKTRILRESSELDLFGGFGLSASYADIKTAEQFSNALFKLKNPHHVDSDRTRIYADSVGKKIKELGSSALLQVQGSPQFWAIAMQHPNNSDYYVIAYSNTQSLETIFQDDTAEDIRPVFGVNLKGHSKYWKRKQYWAIATRGGIVAGDLNETSGTDIVMRVIKEYDALRELGIVQSQRVSIGEFGIMDGNLEVYQYTPVRTRLDGVFQVNPNRLVFGGTNSVELPVVRMPRLRSVELYFMNGNGIDEFPDFKQFVENQKEHYGHAFVPPFIPAEFFVFAYMFDAERRHPTGYLVVADGDARQQFDIPMENARAVLLKTEKPSALALNHNTSRLIYKAPVLVIGEIKDKLQDGQVVRFSCDGADYSIKK